MRVKLLINDNAEYDHHNIYKRYICIDHKGEREREETIARTEEDW